jgi:hypothetical protein
VALEVDCPCGVPHGPGVSVFDSQPSVWERTVRRRILRRDRMRCRVPVPGRPGGICGEPAVVAGHILARVLGGCDRPGNLRAECALHSSAEGGQLRHRNNGGSGMGSVREDIWAGQEGGNGYQAVPFPPPAPAGRGAGRFAGILTPGPGDSVWDAAPWLEELRDVPPEGTWPRLMTLPHPDAVGSYGAEVCAQFTERTGRTLRWWQRLAAARLLEYDADGRLVWLIPLLTLARQLGKSWLLRELLLWRLRQTARWGDQSVVHTGKDLMIVDEIMTPVMTWADGRPGYHTVWNNNRRQLAYRDAAGSSRWIPKAYRSVYGWAGNVACCDEAWKVPPGAVNDGILPILVEQVSPQLLLVSTAHPDTTGLMLTRRALAIAQLFDPVNLLLLEWSAPPEAALEDEGGWRQASPHWTPQRRALIAAALDTALNAEPDPAEPDPIASFRCQWLDQWPHDVEAENPDERVCTVPRWEACLDPSAAPAPGWPVVAAVEDDLGRGAAAAAAGLTPDGRIVIGGYTFGELTDAARWAARMCGDTGILLAGASITRDPAVTDTGIPAEAVGSVEFRPALSALRSLIRTARLAHSGAAEVTGTVTEARVSATPGATQLRITGTDSPALLRCVAWAAHRAHLDRS